MMSRQTPTALCLQVWVYPKKRTVAWFNILWKLQKQINSLPILPAWCRALGSSLGATLGTSFTAFLPSSELYLLHWLDLQEQNSPLNWSRAVKSSCAHHYVLDGSTLPMWKTSGGTFQITETWTRIKQTPTYTWCMVGTHKTSTCADECLITGCSLKSNHPHISGAWIAPAWWPIVVSANQGITSSRIQYWSSFAADAVQLCIKKSF